MLDHRIHTFLTLCGEMNYRKTAQLLNMTQPAVTQHIQYLEQKYGINLFVYDGRSLTKTPEAEKMERYARMLWEQEREMVRDLQDDGTVFLRIGATKSIGEFVIVPIVERFIDNPKHRMELIVDNTENLLAKLDQGDLDFAMVEGSFDKSLYGCQLFRKEPFLGICAPDHPFARKDVELERIFENTILVREQGSGTRNILEQTLSNRGYALKDFQRVISISSFSLIQKFCRDNKGISFVYQAVAHAGKGLETFRIKGLDIVREFNFVYLDERIGNEKVRKFLDNASIFSYNEEIL